VVVNISPDPFTTATASLTEDLLVGGVVALVVTHPWAALAVSMTLLALGALLLALLWRRLRAARARRRAGTTPAGSAGSSARSP
jgi:membrane protein implicated in regulation of membrane protease activity